MIVRLQLIEIDTAGAAFTDIVSVVLIGVFRSFIAPNNRWNQRKKALDWAREQDQRAALHSVKNLSDAVSRWRKKQNCFPKFKKRGCRESFLYCRRLSMQCRWKTYQVAQNRNGQDVFGIAIYG